MIKDLRKKKRVPVSDEERQLMLFWYTIYEGNYNKAAKKVSEETGISRSRKVLFEVAKRHNFATLSHIVRDEVNRRFYGAETPGMGRMLKLTADLMEIDEDLLRQAKLFIQGRRAKIEDIDQLLKVVKHVTQDISNITGDKDIKRSAFSEISKREKPKIGLTIDQITKDMSEEDKADVLGEVVESEISTLLELRGETTERSKKKAQKEDKELRKLSEEYFRDG